MKLPPIDIEVLFKKIKACDESYEKFKDMTPHQIWLAAGESDIDTLITKIFYELTPRMQTMCKNAFWYNTIKDDRYWSRDIRYEDIELTRSCADAIRATISFRTVQAATRRWLGKQEAPPKGE